MGMEEIEPLNGSNDQPSAGAYSYRLRTWIASWGRTGFLLRRLRGNDHGAGTVASLFTLPLVLLLGWGGWLWQLTAAVVLVLVSVWATWDLEGPETDPGWVVVDEAAGTLVATIGLAGGSAGQWLGLVAGWAVFRVFDILKPYFTGISWLERLPKGWGITADDVGAGLYGLAAGWLMLGIL